MFLMVFFLFTQVQTAVTPICIMNMHASVSRFLMTS
jgi:hypothetical protein